MEKNSHDVLDHDIDNEDDDDWYNQMEQHAHSYGDSTDGYHGSHHKQQQRRYHSEDDKNHSNEDLYYSRLGEANTSISDNSFKGERDMVWQQLARQFLHDSLDHVSKHASKLTVINPDRDIFDAAAKFLMEIFAAEGQRHKDCRFQFSGIDIEFHEKVICKLTKFHPQWVEYCGMFVLDSKPAKVEPLSPAFVLSDLEPSDAELINDTWKYKSNESIHMVRNMLQSGNCIGVRTVEDRKLVCWCLTYEDGAIGMLYTLPGYRGRGLAANCVCAVIEKRPIDLFPVFCFIESSNESSKKLFHKLGFMKCGDVVWTGITER